MTSEQREKLLGEGATPKDASRLTTLSQRAQRGDVSEVERDEAYKRMELVAPEYKAAQARAKNRGVERRLLIVELAILGYMQKEIAALIGTDPMVVAWALGTSRRQPRKRVPVERARRVPK